MEEVERLRLKGHSSLYRDNSREMVPFSQDKTPSSKLKTDVQHPPPLKAESLYRSVLDHVRFRRYLSWTAWEIQTTRKDGVEEVAEVARGEKAEESGLHRGDFEE